MSVRGGEAGTGAWRPLALLQLVREACVRVSAARAVSATPAGRHHSVPNTGRGWGPPGAVPAPPQMCAALGSAAAQPAAALGLQGAAQVGRKWRAGTGCSVGAAWGQGSGQRPGCEGQGEVSWEVGGRGLRGRGHVPLGVRRGRGSGRMEEQ